ncbi:hypothetical protein [Glycomyces salinus]|uniref:hypothetical protein n=1 Tax=Glycomyces salinus TaxID=980294 RepID=UPI0018EC6952|nr:hypothetical protein [Glycomyces salinus]
MDEGRPPRGDSGSRLIDLAQRLVLKKGFDPDDFVISGSARLWLSGHRDRISDIDIVARGETWSRALELVYDGQGYLATTHISGAKVVKLHGGLIEVADHWFMEGSDTDDLIDSAEIIDGLRYFGFGEIIAYKLKLFRPKDRADLARMGLLPDSPPRWPYPSGRIEVPRQVPREAGNRQPGNRATLVTV